MSTAPKLATTAPERSLDQRMEALRRANDVRVQRAQLKRDLKAGATSVADVLREPPEYLLTAKVFDVLLAVPRCGRVKATKLLQTCRISTAKTVGGLSDRQRAELIDLLAGRQAIGRLFVISGPSGAGKGTLIRNVLERRPGLARVAISATTRPRRPGEEDGREYFFLGDDEFQRRVDNDEFEEHVSFAGGRYGTLRSEVDRLLAAGENVILELEVDGAFAIRRRRPDAVLIFIDAPLPELERRLTARATEMAGEIQMRLDIARRQHAARDHFDHVVVNDDVGRATDELLATMVAELGASSPTFSLQRDTGST